MAVCLVSVAVVVIMAMMMAIVAVATPFKDRAGWGGRWASGVRNASGGGRRACPCQSTKGDEDVAP